MSKSLSFKASFHPKGKSPKAVMPPITLPAGDTSPTITLNVVDAVGVVIPITDPSTVATTLTADDASKISLSGSGLSFSGTIPAGATGSFSLNATLAFNDGSAGPFTASVTVTLPTPPPPTPVDLTITIS